MTDGYGLKNAEHRRSRAFSLDAEDTAERVVICDKMKPAGGQWGHS